ncbi:MAG: nickel pincer cofactor biosynthesis protein LarC [Desulfobacterales bacterium]|nr:nickel pincer cofactor biosynthesis protein LarC [Desulfobacterales bacterium]
METVPPKIAYADCFSGISGDMFLAGLLDSGLPGEVLHGGLARLGLDRVELTISREKQQGLSATRVRITVADEQPPRTWKNIQALLKECELSAPVKKKSLAVFAALAGAEAKVHGCPVDEVHFHELGGVDALVDIVGTVIGLDHLKIEKIIASPLPMPRGWVTCGHGRLPLPAPAVCELLKGVEVYGVDLDQELVTPTGAALLKTLASGFGPMPPMVIDRVGYGSGSRVRKDGRPNLFRLIIGQALTCTEAREVEVIETNLDDWSPESFQFVSEQLFGAGALDVSIAPIQMKKGRPGFLLQVLADPAHALACKQLILTETTAIGLRFRIEQRLTLDRTLGHVVTPWGRVQVKKVETPRGPVLYPEYEDCCRLARAYKIPLKEIYGKVGRRGVAEFIPIADQGEKNK